MTKWFKFWRLPFEEIHLLRLHNMIKFGSIAFSWLNTFQ